MTIALRPRFIRITQSANSITAEHERLYWSHSVIPDIDDCRPQHALRDFHDIGADSERPIARRARPGREAHRTKQAPCGAAGAACRLTGVPGTAGGDFSRAEEAPRQSDGGFERRQPGDSAGEPGAPLRRRHRTVLFARPRRSSGTYGRLSIGMTSIPCVDTFRFDTT